MEVYSALCVCVSKSPSPCKDTSYLVWGTPESSLTSSLDCICKDTFCIRSFPGVRTSTYLFLGGAGWALLNSAGGMV